jgi:hypothetical protein
MELFATTGNAFVKVGAHTRLHGSGAQCLALEGARCTSEPSRLFRSGDGGASCEELVALQEIPSRSDWSFPPRPWTPHVRWIAPSPHTIGT